MHTFHYSKAEHSVKITYYLLTTPVKLALQKDRKRTCLQSLYEFCFG